MNGELRDKAMDCGEYFNLKGREEEKFDICSVAL